MLCCAPPAAGPGSALQRSLPLPPPSPPPARPQSELGGSAFEGVKESVGNFFSNTLGGLMGGKKEEEKAA